jgi:cytochrome c oxidase assembly protein subunit 15
VEGPLHAWIEFGNRLLTFALFFAALATIAYVLKLRRRELFLLSLFQLLGILGQGVLGGITVLTDLNPYAVASHFILSIFLIAGASLLRARAINAPRYHLQRIPTLTARALVILTFLVITVGTIVTGSGPHAGDIKAPRTGLDPRTISILHADMVIALIFLTIGLLIALRLGESGETQATITRRTSIFLGVVLAQGLIGYVQYFTGLPELIVAAHLIGATLVWLAATHLAIQGRVFHR